MINERVRDKVIWAVSPKGAKDLRQGVKLVRAPLLISMCRKMNPVGMTEY